MASIEYNVEAYQHFAENLQTLLNGPNIKKTRLKDLRKPAIKTGQQTRFGSWGWRATDIE